MEYSTFRAAQEAAIVAIRAEAPNEPILIHPHGRTACTVQAGAFVRSVGQHMEADGPDSMAMRFDPPEGPFKVSVD